VLAAPSRPAMTPEVRPSSTNGTIEMRHAFRTFLGLPPDTDEAPVCGAVLAVDWRAGPGDPACPACLREASRAIVAHRLDTPTPR